MEDASASGEGRKERPWWFMMAVVGGIGAAVLLVMGAILAGVAIPAYKSKVVATNESAALSHLGEIAAQQHVHLTSTGNYTSFRGLVAAGLLDAKYDSDAPVLNGYTFTMKVTPRTESQPPFFGVNADPVDTQSFTPSGKRHFYLDSETAGIRYHEERPATAADRAR
jgi:Tfp pilus assembly protein PilE